MPKSAGSHVTMKAIEIFGKNKTRSPGSVTFKDRSPPHAHRSRVVKQKSTKLGHTKSRPPQRHAPSYPREAITILDKKQPDIKTQ